MKFHNLVLAFNRDLADAARTRLRAGRRRAAFH
jgi:hypothetical protein